MVEEKKKIPKKKVEKVAVIEINPLNPPLAWYRVCPNICLSIRCDLIEECWKIRRVEEEEIPKEEK